MGVLEYFELVHDERSLNCGLKSSADTMSMLRTIL